MQHLYIYTFENDDLKWNTVNDGVMGGVSSSSFIINDGVGIFKGAISLENNGGFASVRASIAPQSLGNSSKVILKIKGDGKTYKFRIRTNDNFDGIAYSVDFQTQNNDTWEEIVLPFTLFKASFRGYVINDAPAINAEEIKQIGFLIGNKKAEDFKLAIDWIKIE